MFAQHFQLSARRPFRAALSWISLAWYLAISLGVPLPVGGDKDLSRPFLCMYSRCGCRDADQCYRSCCCHTAAERVAFARRHGETPPFELLAAAAAESHGVSAPDRACCAPRRADVPTPERGGVEGSESRPVVIQDALACRGADRFWLHAGVALPPTVARLQLGLVEMEAAAPVAHFAESVSTAPPSRPPRGV